MYRIQIKLNGKFRTGINEYTLEEAEVRARYYRTKGKKARIISNADLDIIE